jgi:AraC-like DNA-binding protein
MHSTLKANKLLLIEKKNKAILPDGQLPEEYKKLRIPSAGFYIRQDDECDILSQHVEAGPFSLWMHDIFAKEDIVLLPYSPYHIWALQYTFEDSLAVEREKGGSFNLDEKECNLFDLQPGLHRIPMEADKKVLAVHININPAAIQGLALQYPELSIISALACSNTNNLLNEQPHHINPLADLLIQKILSCQYTGSRANHFIRRCCADLFINFARQHAASAEPFLFTSVLHMDTYIQLFNYLVNHTHRIHTIPELAYMFFQSPEELCKGFEQHFAMSIASFTHMLRMMMTYGLLHKGKIPLREIAKTMKYGSVEEMVNQLELYYDCPLEQMK